MKAADYSLFFALSPGEDLRRQLSQTAALLKSQHPSPNHTSSHWVPAHRYHLTLQYVDEFEQRPDAWAQKLIAAAERVRACRFQLQLDQAGSFDGNQQIPWWLGTSDIPREFDRLCLAIKQALAESGIRNHARKKTKPHLTVLRNAGRTLPLRPVPPLVWDVREFVLIESFLGSPMTHRTLATWPLKEPADCDAGHSPQRDLWDN